MRPPSRTARNLDDVRSAVSLARERAVAGESTLRASIESEALLEDLRDDLERDRASLEASLARACTERELKVGKATARLLAAGGKRSRPLLTCMFLRALGHEPEPHVDVIAAVELAHTGSLLHDDIIDGAQTRRGLSAAHLEYNIPTAILAGDLLIVAAIDRTTRAGSRLLQMQFNEALKDLCTGVALEREHLFDSGIDVACARQVNRLKTASLFSYAAEAGAILAGAGEDVRAAARAFGTELGEAFQLTDDLLDLQGLSKDLGKPVGTDLASGWISVPLATALEREPRLREVVREVWGSSEARLDAARRLRRGVEASGALEQTLETAGAAVERACTALEALPPRPWRDQLHIFAHAVIHRTK